MLRADWVEALLAKLLVRYGDKWVRMWDGIPMAAITEDWSEVLDGLSAESIRHALQHLPADWPPNSQQFRELALKRPEKAILALPAPKVDPQRVRDVMSGINRPQGNGRRDWAHRLREREVACDALTKFQRDAWREALKPETETTE